MAAGPDSQVLDIARRYVEALRRANVSFESVWLFGSGATGRNTPDSDIDVGIVMREVSERFETELRLMKMRRPIDLRIEPHVLTLEEWESPFFGKSIRETGTRVDRSPSGSDAAAPKR